MPGLCPKGALDRRFAAIRHTIGTQNEEQAYHESGGTDRAVTPRWLGEPLMHSSDHTLKRARRDAISELGDSVRQA